MSAILHLVILPLRVTQLILQVPGKRRNFNGEWFSTMLACKASSFGFKTVQFLVID